MALMYPRSLLADDHTSPGELKVFAALRDQLDDSWEAYHSVGVIDDTPHGAKDGEIDFVLCHPDRGMFCLEVKGGDIECRHGEWYRHGERVTDPFAQVVAHKHKLLKQLDVHGGWDTREVLTGHAVVLPDIPVHSLVLGADAPPELVIDRNAMKDIVAALEAAFAYHEGVRDKRHPPGTDGATRLRNLLAPAVSISVPLSTTFDEENVTLVELTREQSIALGRLARNPRMAVYGCAGSGKTMLAVEHARRLAEQGRHVLFVCFNKALAAHLKQSSGRPGIEFTTFHRLCSRMAKRAGVEMNEYPLGEAPQAFFDSELPEALLEAVDALGPQYDALIVDEAQDLSNDWLDALRCCLRNEAAAPIWLFLDDNQRIYHSELTLPEHFFAYELGTNCRNTQAIHHELLKLYTGTVAPDVRGPQGRQPELVFTSDQPAEVARILDRLLGPDAVSEPDIVVLSSHGTTNSTVAAALAHRLADGWPKLGSRKTRFSSIRAFKGLEASVVVLCELEDTDEQTRDGQIYVGLSRATNHCVIVVPKS